MRITFIFDAECGNDVRKKYCSDIKKHNS